MAEPEEAQGTEPDEVMDMHVFLKSGASFRVPVIDARFEETYARSKSLNWVSPAGWQSRILHVDLDEVAAIVMEKRRGSTFDVPTTFS